MTPACEPGASPCPVGAPLRRRLLAATAGLALAAAAGVLVPPLRRRGQRAHEAGAALAAAAAAEVCIVAAPVPYDPASGLPVEAPRAVPADARCPVCGMFPARAPQWAAQLIHADGSAHFFDSPLSLFQYLVTRALDPGARWPAAVRAAYVHAMEEGGWVSAQDAVYVAGSSLRGPMRNGNFPSFGSPAAAARFARERGGWTLSASRLAEHVRTAMPLPPGHPHGVAAGA